MRAKEYIKRIALFACVYDTAITFLLLFILFVVNADLSRGVHPVALIAIFPFSFAFSGANTIYRHAKLKKGVRLLLHYLLTVGGALLFLYLPNRSPEHTASAAFLLFIALTALYSVVMALILGVSARARRVKRDSAEYRDVYRKK